MGLIMKRLHLHVSVPSMERAVEFYSTLFDIPPSVLKADYAKWMLEDPRVKLAISSCARAIGVDHVGVQADSSVELADLASRSKAAGEITVDQGATACCYAKSDKSWLTDTAGVRWETFYTHGEATEYGEDETLPDQTGSTCCTGPATACR